MMAARRVRVGVLRTPFLAIVLVLAFSSTSRATPLDLQLSAYPDIMAGYLSASYKVLTSTFQATGWALTLDTGSGLQSIMTNFALSATINSSGAASGGTLRVGTTTAPLLYSTNLLAFGYNAIPGGTLEFVFGSPTGSLADIYDAPLGVGVILSQFGGFGGSWTSDWSSNYSSGGYGVGDVAPVVPEPSTLVLLLTGAGGLVGRQLRRRKKEGAG